MSALGPVVADEIATFLPGCAGAEYELRAKLRSHRSVASALIANTTSPSARTLAWVAVDYTNAFLLAPVPEPTLANVAKLCNRLLVTALQVERLETEGAGYGRS